MKVGKAPWLPRPDLRRTGPHRTAGHYFRSAASDGKGQGGKAIAGVPLASTEAAVVAAVRMAYKVAETQIDRSARLARRLREAGDQLTGQRSDKQALDATERLVFRTMMTVLGWVEAAATDNGNPLRRLGAAQYQLLGAMLGLTPAQPAPRPEGGAPGRPAAPSEPGPSGRSAPADQGPPRFPVRIQHVGPDRRAVHVRAWEYTDTARVGTAIPVTFYNVAQPSRRPLTGEVVIGDRRSVTLKLTASSAAPSGRWRAALCDVDGLQIGRIEIVF